MFISNLLMPLRPYRPRHQVTRPSRIQKADLHQRLFQMLVIKLQFIGGHRLGIDQRRSLLLFHLGWLPLGRQPGHAHLVGQHLYGRRQV